MSSITIEKRPLTVAEYQDLRQSTGWNIFEDAVVEKALQQDLFTVCVLDQEKLVGIGRVIGDGALYFYVQDIIVLPAYQKQGIGRMIMQAIEAFLEKATYQHSFVGLMAAAGVAEFYEQFGYRKRPEAGPGMFKVMKKKD